MERALVPGDRKGLGALLRPLLEGGGGAVILFCCHPHLLLKATVRAVASLTFRALFPPFAQLMFTDLQATVIGSGSVCCTLTA